MAILDAFKRKIVKWLKCDSMKFTTKLLCLNYSPDTNKAVEIDDCDNITIYTFEDFIMIKEEVKELKLLVEWIIYPKENPKLVIVKYKNFRCIIIAGKDSKQYAHELRMSCVNCNLCKKLPIIKTLENSSLIKEETEPLLLLASI